MHIEQFDMSLFYNSSTPQTRLTFAYKLGQALSKTGFVTIVRHKISPQIIQLGYKQAKALFALPKDVLVKYEHPENGHQTGYTPFGHEHAKDRPDEGDLKEHWNIRRPLSPDHPRVSHPSYFPNVWPDEHLPSFQPAALQLFYALDQLCEELLGILETYLGYEPNTLVDMMTDGETLMRVLHYPPVVGTPKAIRSAAHEDINLITLLIAGTEPGLEVKTPEGVWIPVNESPGSIVVNVGDMLQMLTDGVLPSVTHRVVNPPENANVDRYSWPFFGHPRGEVVLHKKTGYTAAMYLAYRLWQIGMLELDQEPLPPPEIGLDR